MNSEDALEDESKPEIYDETEMPTLKGARDKAIADQEEKYLRRSARRCRRQYPERLRNIRSFSFPII